MKIKPEERPTVIGLGVAIAGVLFYGATHFLPQVLSGNKPAVVQPATASNGAIAPAAPGTLNPAIPSGAGTVNPGMSGMSAQNLASVSKVNMYDDAVPEPATTRDPFTPAVQMAEINPFNRPIAQTSILPTAQPIVRIPTPSVAVIKPTFPFRQPPVSSSNGVMPETDASLQANQMILAGVITGPQAVAVIHIGDRAYPLTSGEKMPYNMSLARITEDGVYVKQGKKMWFIQVGKSLSVAMPIKPGQQGFNAHGSMAPNTTSGPERRVAATGADNSVSFGEPLP